MDTTESTLSENEGYEPESSTAHNIGTTERWVTGVAGAALAVIGLARRSSTGWAMAALGGILTGRAISGYCPAYQALGIGPGRRRSAPISVNRVVTIDKPAQQLYEHWRDLPRLPQLFDHLESIVIREGGISHWVARGPAGIRVEWDAELTDDSPGRRIAWRSVPVEQGMVPSVETEGQVTFRPVYGGRSTEVRVQFLYVPPAGTLGAVIAGLLGREPAQVAEEALRRFKQLAETGEIATTRGQPSGRFRMAHEPGFGLKRAADALDTLRRTTSKMEVSP